VITSAEFKNIPLFAGVEEQEQRRLARRAAGIYLEPGEWLIREGEEPRSLSSWQVTSTDGCMGIMLSVSSGCEMKT
jgi:hypothetical protein